MERGTAFLFFCRAMQYGTSALKLVCNELKCLLQVVQQSRTGRGRARRAGDVQTTPWSLAWHQNDFFFLLRASGVLIYDLIPTRDDKGLHTAARCRPQ